MKKWTIRYLVIVLLLFLFGVGFQTNQMKNEGTFSSISEGSNVFCQAATQGRRTDIIVWGDGKSHAVRVDEKKKAFQLLDMAVVNDEAIYYQYQYIDKNSNKKYGLGVIDLSTYKGETLDTWPCSGEDWVAFGYHKKTNQIIYETTSDKADKYLEYRKSLPWSKGSWEKVAKSKELVSIEPKTSNIENTLFKKARGQWTKICFQHAFAKLFFGYFIIALIIGAFLYGVLGEFSVIVRIISGLQLMLLVVMGISFILGSAVAVNHVLDEKEDAIKTNLSYILSDMGNEEKITDELLKDYDLMYGDELAEVTCVKHTKTDIKLTASSLGIIDEEVPKYNKSINILYKKAIEDKKSVDGFVTYKKETTDAVVVYDYYHANERNLILVVFEPFYVNEVIRSSMAGLGKPMLLIYILSAIALAMLGVFYELRWREFVRTSKSIILDPEGMTTADIFEKKFSGFDVLWKLVLKMYEMMKESIYQMEKGLEFGYRFVPAGLERLFRKEDLSNLLVGEHEDKSGDMALLSVGSIKHMSSDDYLDKISWIFGMVNEQQVEENGVWVHHDPDFINNKIFFEDKGSALDFALKVVKTLEGDSELADTPKLVLIHNDRYHFGIAGNSEKAFSYAYSKIDDELDDFRERLCFAGVRVAMTESVYNNNKDINKMRNIGFVVGRKTGEKIKIYECLDAYDHEKRALYLATEKLFEQALGFFYSNDFYLARNIFNEVIQINSSDEIARSYLFKCEYYLNHERTDQFMYGLFED